jgi:hypothetical protein
MGCPGPRPATTKSVILSGGRRGDRSRKPALSEDSPPGGQSESNGDLQLLFAISTPHNKWGAPCPDFGTWDSTNPNQQVLCQGWARRLGIHPRLPQTVQKRERALASAETPEGAGAFRPLNGSTRRTGFSPGPHTIKSVTLTAQPNLLTMCHPERRSPTRPARRICSRS